MTSQLIPFQFETSAIRVVVINDQPMFGARDVALALGYADPAYAYKTHCKSLKLLSYEESSELGWKNPNPRGEYVMVESPPGKTGTAPTGGQVEFASEP